mgnify:FL=1
MNEMTRARALQLADDALSIADGAMTLKERVANFLVQAYVNGLTEYAWWKDGTQYVGTCGRTLAEAIADTQR